MNPTVRAALTLVATSLPDWLLVFLCLFFGLAFLFPLLASRKLRENYFVFFYQFVEVTWADVLAKARRTALTVLDELESHDPELRKQGALRLLEIGAGTGANFKHIKRPLKYTNVDPTRGFASLFQEELKRHPHIEMERWVQAYGEDMRELDDDQFDVVLLTYIFCSVADRLKVLMEAKRVLVKGGRVIFLEHVAHPKGTWKRLLQDVVNPLWKVATCNCHINRDCPQVLMQSVGFSNVNWDYMLLDMPVLLSLHAHGDAVA